MQHWKKMDQRMEFKEEKRQKEEETNKKGSLNPEQPRGTKVYEKKIVNSKHLLPRP